MPAKPQNKRTSLHEVEIVFPSSSRESLLFNRFELFKDDGFLFLKLGWTDESGVTPIFFGAISLREAKESVGSFKSYIERIGGPGIEDDFAFRTRDVFPKPVYFNHLGAAINGEVGEISCGHFSHKSASDASRAAEGKRSVAGALIGVYSSPGTVHRKLIWDLIKIHEQ